jgi:hypothetical protein
MELRCLMSSRNSSMNFDLRCNVREKMTAWIQQNYPDAFPRTRFAALSPTSDPTAPAPSPIGSTGQTPPQHDPVGGRIK